MHRLQGDFVELYRYKITYETVETPYDEDGIPANQPIEQVEFCVLDIYKEEFIEHLNKQKVTEYQVEPIDQAGNEWLDGMEFEDARQAIMAFSMGETAYIEYRNNNDIELISRRGRDISALTFVHLAEKYSDEFDITTLGENADLFSEYVPGIPYAAGQIRSILIPSYDSTTHSSMILTPQCILMHIIGQTVCVG